MFGVCYYPEHWPRSSWERDAAAMAELGLSCVRIGEFAWSRLEPIDGQLQFDWLDDAIGVLCGAGLKVVMGTPTATPPKWLVDKLPDMLPVDPETGRTRGFGSRRHYDFSSEAYLAEALRITEVMARRYGSHDGVVGWQTDNELCCHDTTLSASESARAAFQRWCRGRYETTDALNAAWGNVFWSMEYGDFQQIELPTGAVTETNPAHRLAYRRFSSEKVVQWHERMVEVIRRHAPGKFITHNFIPMSQTGVDNFSLAGPLDFASYDSYPLGHTDIQFRSAPAEVFSKYMRTGHPDFATYFLDQTRCLTDGGFWVMEQQPGPVNWADNNPRPAPGMVRLWTLEAFAHGADCVSYFRWRQAPFAQEQMHAGLLRPDNSRASAWQEVEQAIADMALLNEQMDSKQAASVAIVTTAESFWVTDIERQSESYRYDEVQFGYYHAFRRMGVSVDFINADADFDGYKLVVVPCLPIVDDAFVAKCEQCSATIVFGPRSGSKTAEFGFPPELPPGPLQRIAPVKVLSVETLRPDCIEALVWSGEQYDSVIWREQLDAPDADVLARYADDSAAIVRFDRIIYVGTLTGGEFLQNFLAHLCNEVSVNTFDLPPDVRIEQRGNLLFACNYSDIEQELLLDEAAQVLLGQKRIQPHDVTVWQLCPPGSCVL
ncbi:MAG: beta-galactosidase [Gammaproteobacteria bacterium]|nr:beta-galactosidase [Gammaproteobacteria bacterium]